jgi:hypothetical protein
VNWIECVLLACDPIWVTWLPAASGPAAVECIVVRVVVNDRRDGAGDENVLSAPLPVLGTPPTVADVPAPDEAPWDCAASASVDIVGATDRFPIVGGGRPSTEERHERLLRSMDVVLAVRPVGTVEEDKCPFTGAVELPFNGPDAIYGLLFFDGPCFFE